MFEAKLTTTKTLQRPVTFYHKEQSNVEIAVNNYLKVKGIEGDSFTICEAVKVERSIITYDKTNHN